MLIDVKVPVLAESVTEATLLEWRKSPGDVVKRGDNLIDIETDKVTLEVTALHDGVLEEIVNKDGETVSSEQVIARINTTAQAQESTAADTEDTGSTGESDETVPPLIAAINSKKITEQENIVSPAASHQSNRTGPAVRSILAKEKIDSNNVDSNKNDGRITKADLIEHLQNKQVARDGLASVTATSTFRLAEESEERDVAEARSDIDSATLTTARNTKDRLATETPSPAATKSATTTASTDENRIQNRVAMTRLRKRAAQRLLGAQHNNALLTTFNEVNMQEIIQLRTQYKEEFEKKHQIKLGFMSFFTRAAVEALKLFPIINASVEEDDILYHKFFDIGIAVSSPRGLVVPIIRDVDQLSLAEIEKHIRELGDKARTGKLTMDDLTGGTFTITNGGVFGSLVSTPIVNPPQSAILGMHAIQQRPIAEQGQVVIRPMMYLALTYDHRIIDGSDAVQFLVTIKKQLEDPTRLLLQL